MMDTKQLMWDVGCGELTGDFYAVTPAQLENIIAKVHANALAQQGEQPVYWEWRVLDTHPQTVTSGQWSDWKRVEPRNPNIGTVQDTLAEIQYYIDQGHKYELRALYTAAPAPQPKGLFIDMITEHGPEFVAEIAAIGETAPQPAQSNQVLIDALKLCYEHCRVYHPEVETNNVGQAVRAALQSAQPVAWTHSCNALCTDGLELWCDHCPHCGKPRTTHAEQWPPGLITDIVLTVTALHKEVDIGWSPDARSHLSRLSTSIGMLATTHPAPQPAHEGGKQQLPPFQPCTAGAMCLDCQPRGASDECPDATAWTDGKGYATTSKTIAEHHAANGEQMMELVARGCAYCNHPMYLGRACKNCGRDVAPPVVKT